MQGSCGQRGGAQTLWDPFRARQFHEHLIVHGMDYCPPLQMRRLSLRQLREPLEFVLLVNDPAEQLLRPGEGRGRALGKPREESPGQHWQPAPREDVLSCEAASPLISLEGCAGCGCGVAGGGDGSSSQNHGAEWGHCPSLPAAHSPPGLHTAPPAPTAVGQPEESCPAPTREQE